jgi:Na+-translocating ferredoxin:NAD+ oxidoreductase RnfE subunit
MMNEDLKKCLILSMPLPVLGLGLIAPAVAGVTPVAAVYLGLCATVILIIAGTVIALFSLRIPKNARIGIAVMAAGGILAIVKIAAARLIAEPLPLETLGPLVIIAAVLAAEGETYSVKKKFLPVVFDGAGIGGAFTVLLVLTVLFRDVAGKKLFAGKTAMQLEFFQFFATTPGILLLTAFVVLCLGLITTGRKKQETQK